MANLKCTIDFSEIDNLCEKMQRLNAALKEANSLIYELASRESPISIRLETDKILES